jgi:hypothetical protein
MLLSVIDWKVTIDRHHHHQQQQQRKNRDHSIDGTMRESRIELGKIADLVVEVNWIDYLLVIIFISFHYVISLATKSASNKRHRINFPHNFCTSFLPRRPIDL